MGWNNCPACRGRYWAPPERACPACPAIDAAMGEAFLSDRDRSHVETTRRLLLAKAKRLRAAIAQSPDPRAVLLAALRCETGAEACAALLATPKDPPEPAGSTAGPSP